MEKSLILCGLLFLLISFQCHSQEDQVSDNFAYRSFSISPFGIYAGGSNGVTVSGDVSFDYGKNIFSLGLGAGTEGNVIGKNHDFFEVNFLYGRSIPLSGKIFTDIFIGAGYFHFNTFGFIPEIGRSGDISEKTIGFPIGAKFQFKIGPRYSMGLKLGANINSVETIGTLGLVLQWNKKRN